MEHKKTQKPIVFARVTRDSVFNATIWDLVVDLLFQRIRLGKAMMERLINRLLEKEKILENVGLESPFADSVLCPFSFYFFFIIYLIFLCYLLVLTIEDIIIVWLWVSICNCGWGLRWLVVMEVV